MRLKPIRVFIKRYKSMTSIKSNQGFTLVELLVTLVVSGVVLAGISSTFYSQHTSYLNQEQMVSIQQNLRAAMYIMEREIRMAGHDPDGDSGAGIVAANSDSIRIAQDLTNNAGTGIPDGDVGDPGENITYSLQDADGDGDTDLVRNDHNGAGVQMFAEDIDALNFESVKYLETAQAHFPRHYPMCLTLLRTGMRLGEVVALQPGDIDFNRRFIEVQRTYSKGHITPPKTNHRRRIDMSGQLAEVLKAHLLQAKKDTLKNGWKEPPEWLFYNTIGVLLDGDKWRKKVHKKILEKAGIRHVRIHDLRHTYATLRLMKGDNLIDVSKQLGHASVKMTLDVYAHWIPGGKKSEVDGLDSKTAPLAEATNG